MKKILSLLVLVSLFVTSCSELPEYELPYDVAPTAEAGVNVTVTPSNALCPGPNVTVAVDSESSVFYVIQPTADDALTSEEVFDDGEVLTFEAEGSEEINIEGLDLETNYTIYAVTVNEDGIRSEEVATTTFVTPSFSEVVNPVLATNYTGTAFYSGSAVTSFDATLTESGEFVFEANSLWGDWVAWAYENPAYAGYYQYPATVTLNEDFSVDVVSEEFYSLNGSGSFDPCTGIFSLTIDTNLFDDPDTAEVESFSVPVELMPAE